MVKSLSCYLLFLIPEWSSLSTDRDADILDNCTRNVLANSGLYLNGEESVQVRKLDWLQSWPPAVSHDVEDGDEQETRRWNSSSILIIFFVFSLNCGLKNVPIKSILL